MTEKKRGQKEKEQKTKSSHGDAFKEVYSSLSQAHFVVFDIETTGGNPEKNGITEICAIKYSNGRMHGKFYSLVNPGVSIPPIVRRMTGIDNKMVKDAPRIQDVMPDFVKFIGNGILVSHNTIGDMKFLQYFSEKTLGEAIRNFFLCTHLLVDKLAPESPEKSLSGLAKFFDIHVSDTHRAEADAHITLELFKVLLGKLAGRHFERVDQAIRLQGDIDSGIRLGWGIKPQSLERLPHSCGLYYLYDHERRVVFYSSALNINREVKKLQKYDQMPRNILRIALKSYDIQIERTANSYAAMLMECDSVKSTRIQVDLLAWHHRIVDALYIRRHENQIVLGVGPVPEGTIHAFGPVRDHKEALGLLDRMALALEIPGKRKEIFLSAEYESFVVGFLKGQIKKDFWSLDIVETIVNFWRKTEREKLAQERKIKEVLFNTPRPKDLHPLLDEIGLLIVPGGSAAEWELHSIVGSRPVSVQVIKGDYEIKLAQAGLGKRILESILKTQKQVHGTKIPLSHDAALRVNATLWWLATNSARQEGAFLTLDDLRRIAKT